MQSFLLKETLKKDSLSDQSQNVDETKKPREDCPDESHVLNSLALKGVFESSLKTLSV